MSSVKDITSSNPIPDDFAAKIGSDGINVILATMWLSYSDLKNSGAITTSMDEDSITIEWYAMIYDRWTSENRASQVNLKLVPMNQYPDATLKKARGKTPAIDFCFRAWDKNDGYFGAECKRLRSDQTSLVREYVTSGVMRFTEGKYGAKSSVSAMIGYVQEGSVSEIVDMIKPVMTLSNLEQNLVRVLVEKNPEYKSIHIRDTDSCAITLHHLFFDFVA